VLFRLSYDAGRMSSTCETRGREVMSGARPTSKSVEAMGSSTSEGSEGIPDSSMSSTFSRMTVFFTENGGEPGGAGYESPRRELDDGAEPASSLDAPGNTTSAGTRGTPVNETSSILLRGRIVREIKGGFLARQVEHSGPAYRSN